MKTRSNTLTWIAIIIFSSVVIFDIAYGDDHRNYDDDDGDDGDITNVLTGGDNTANTVATNSISGGRSFGLGLGDVDINDCLYSWSFIVQGVGLNKWCASERMDVMGLHDSAALMRCTIRKVNKLYKTKEQCIKAQTVVKTFPVKRPEPTVDTDEDDDDRYEALYARMAAYEDQYTQRVERAEKVAQRASATAIRAEQRSVSQYGITEEQRQALAEVFKQ